MNHQLGSILLVLLTLSQLSDAASTSPLWVASSLFKCGVVTFAYSNSSVITQTMTVTYSSPLTNSSTKVPVLGITDIQYIITSFTIDVSVLFTSKTISSFTFTVKVKANSNLNLLKVSYLTIDNAFKPSVSLSYISVSPNIIKGQNYSSQVNFTASTGVVLDITHQNVMVPFINYMWIISNDGQMDINLNFSLLNGSYYKLAIITDANMTLKAIAISRMIFDKTAIQGMGSDYFDYGVAVGLNNANLVITIPPDILLSNLFFGLHSFTFSTGVTQLNYNSNYSISTGSLGLYPQSGFVYTKMSMSYFHHKTRTCPDTHPYFNITEKLCYDVCSTVYWWTDNSTMLCKACLYDCYTCTNSSNCATCDANISFRELNNISSRCVAIAGYYDDGSTNVAKSCGGNCATCVSPGTSCLSCVVGSYQNGTSCLSCLANCATCTSSTACTACLNTFTLISDTNCSCTTTQYLASGQCQVCSAAIAGCTTCSSATNCTACSATFTLISATNCSCNTTSYLTSSNLCRLCSLDIAKCNSCTNATTCTACATSFSLISPTNCDCSSTEYLSSGICNACSSAITRCTSCSNASHCTACDATFTLLSTTSCTCNSTQYQASNQCNLCSQAIPYCVTCSNATTCTSCPSTLTLQSGSCTCTSLQYLNTTSTQCLSCTQITPFCQTCTNTTCNSCAVSFTLQNNICVCPSGRYSNSTTNNCQACSIIPNCLTCSLTSVCTSCEISYLVNSTSFQCDYVAPPCSLPNCQLCADNDQTKCISCNSGYSVNLDAVCEKYCGNRAIDSSEECDDGNLVQADGCSSTCKLQAGFTCNIQVVNSTSSFSKCFYSGKISAKKVWIRKLEGVNTLKCLFQLEQLIYHYRFMNFSKLVDVEYNDPNSTRLLATSDLIQSYSAQYDAETNRYFVLIYYLVGLQDKNLVFKFNPYKDNTSSTFSPPAGSSFTPQEFNLNVTVIPDNNQQANFYTEQQYGLCSVSLVISYSLLGLAATALIAAILFRSGTLIVVDLITIMQVTYFSLTFLDSLNPVFGGLLPFRYLAGVLTFKDIQAYLEQSSSPTSMKGSYMFLNLSENMGWAALCICCSLFLGILLAIVYKIYVRNAETQQLKDEDIPHHEKKGERIRRFAFYFIGQLSLSFVFLFLPIYTLSLLFEILYALGEIKVWSYVYAAGFFVGIVIFFVALIRSRSKVKKVSSFSKMGEFVSEFTCEKGFRYFKYSNWQMLWIMLMSSLVMLTIYSNNRLFSPLCFMLLALIDIIIVAVVQPYRFGFASCCKAGRNYGQRIYEKVQLIEDKPKDKQGGVLQPDLAKDWNQFKKNLKHMQQHVPQSKPTQAGQEMQSKDVEKPFFLNNNTRRIINLASLILIEAVFICARIFNEQINRSYGTLSIQNCLPLFVHVILVINAVYNCFLLVLQVLARRRQYIAKVQNEQDLQKIVGNIDYISEPSKEKIQVIQVMWPSDNTYTHNVSNNSNLHSKNLLINDSTEQNIYEQRPRKMRRESKAARRRRRNIDEEIIGQ